MPFFKFLAKIMYQQISANMQKAIIQSLVNQLHGGIDAELRARCDPCKTILKGSHSLS